MIDDRQAEYGESIEQKIHKHRRNYGFWIAITTDGKEQYNVQSLLFSNYEYLVYHLMC